MHPGLTTFVPRLTLLAEFRNSAIHLGEAGEAETNQLFQTFLGGSCVISDEFGLQCSDLFGEFNNFVAAQLDESLAEVQRAVAEKTARARDHFHQWYAGLHQDQLKGVVKAVEGSYALNSPENDHAYCPACDSRRLITGDLDVDWEVGYNDKGKPDNAYPIVRVIPSGFVSHLCGLSFDNCC